MSLQTNRSELLPERFVFLSYKPDPKILKFIYVLILYMTIIISDFIPERIHNAQIYSTKMQKNIDNNNNRVVLYICKNLL